MMKIFERIYHFFGKLLSGFSGKEFLIFLFFLALSSIFWLMMTLNETYEVEFGVPMRLVGVPKNVVITQELSDTLRVSVRDKGYVIMMYETSNQLRPLKLNFSTYANKQTDRGSVPSSDLQRLIRQQLYNSTSITALKASQLDFTFNYGLNRRIKIQLVGSIVPGGNYYLAHTQITPDFATVYASREVLDKIENVYTDRLDISNFDATVKRTVFLKKIPGAKIVPESVTVTLYPDILTEGSIEVPITAVNKPESLTIRTFPQTVKVTYTVGAKAYRLIQPSDFAVTVDYNEISAHPSDKCKLYLRNRSTFARSAKLETDQVDYLIEQQ
jgi:hypothetical protein